MLYRNPLFPCMNSTAHNVLQKPIVYQSLSPSCSSVVWRMQGLFVPYACVGSSDPVRVLHLFHNKYSGCCCIHLLCKATYNLSLPRLHADYYGLPTTVQLRAAHESRCSLFGVSRSTAQVLYYTWLERYILGPFKELYTALDSSLIMALSFWFLVDISPFCEATDTPVLDMGPSCRSTAVSDINPFCGATYAPILNF